MAILVACVGPESAVDGEGLGGVRTPLTAGPQHLKCAVRSRSDSAADAGVLPK